MVVLENHSKHYIEEIISSTAPSNILVTMGKGKLILYLNVYEHYFLRERKL
jgi:hypothetical protein